LSQNAGSKTIKIGLAKLCFAAMKTTLTHSWRSVTCLLKPDLSAIEDSLPLPAVQRAFLQVKTDLNALADVLLWFDQFNGPPLPDRDWQQCQLVLAEGFTNAVRHAHNGLPVELLIDIEVMIFAGRIEIRLWDCGAPFNLAHQLEQLSSSFDCDAEGGRGLQLMQKLTDGLTYTRTGNRNCLLIVKHYSTGDELPAWKRKR
jgi:serine/threonine-protein kinase RsbW